MEGRGREGEEGEREGREGGERGRVNKRNRDIKGREDIKGNGCCSSTTRRFNTSLSTR